MHNAIGKRAALAGLFGLLLVGSALGTRGCADATHAGQRGNAPDPLPTALDVAFDIPRGSSLGELGLVGRGRVVVGDRAVVTGLVASTGGSVELGTEVRAGAILGEGDVTLGDNCDVRGKVMARGVLRRGAGTAIGGTVGTVVSSDAQRVRWFAHVGPQRRGSMTVEKEQVRVFKPGAYGKLRLRTGARVTLRTGVYVTATLELEPDALLIIDDEDGPVQLHVTGEIELNGMVRAARDRPPNFVIVADGARDVQVRGRYNGVLVAPNADVRVHAPQGGRMSIIGRDVAVDAGARVLGLGFPWADLQQHGDG